MGIWVTEQLKRCSVTQMRHAVVSVVPADLESAYVCINTIQKMILKTKSNFHVIGKPIGVKKRPFVEQALVYVCYC